MSANPLCPFRIEARRPVKQLHSDSAAAFMPAVRRLHACGLIRNERLVVPARRRRSLSLRHACETLAREAGASGWPTLVGGGTVPAIPDAARLANDGGCHLNHWFATHEEAEQARTAHGDAVARAGHTFGLLDEGVARGLGLRPAAARPS